MKHNTCVSIHRFADHHHLRDVRCWAWLCVAALSLNACALLQAAQRPIADFTSRQGTFCLDASFTCVGYGGSGCSLFVPPQPNVIGFIDPNTANFVLVDYSGSANSLKPLGTTVDGSITEVALDDGRAEVVVVLHTRNALAWASDISSSFPGPTLFGHRLDEVLAGGDPALADSLLQVTFKNTSPGAPLPDIIQLVNCPDPGQELESISFRA